MVDIGTHGMVHGYKIISQVIQADKRASIPVNIRGGAVGPFKIPLGHLLQAVPVRHAVSRIPGIGIQELVQTGLVHQKQFRGLD